MNADGVPRKVTLVIEDDGAEMFNFRLEGDIERLSMPQIAPSLYSAAEYWGLEVLKMLDERLKSTTEVKKLNREERRRQ
jgi:hypothetical protein